MYITPAQLADQPGAEELAQVATPERDAIVDAALMDATLRGTDRSAWQAADIAVADSALARINQAITDASGLIDGFLSQRYQLPLASVPGMVVVWARSLVRYALHKNRITDPKSDPIARDRTDAMNMLQLTATGKFSLGVPDPAPSSDAPQFSAPGRTFTGDSLGDFTADPFATGAQ